MIILGVQSRQARLVMLPRIFQQLWWRPQGIASEDRMREMVVSICDMSFTTPVALAPSPAQLGLLEDSQRSFS